MADSKVPHLSDNGLMVAAMAYRVKYRKLDTDGKVCKILVRIESMGVHKKNRGGVYPAGVRCKSLCVEVLKAGFVKEEFNHAFIAVEEAPVAEVIRAGGAGMVSASTYNAEHSSKDELLITCFQAPYDDVRHPLLSHNHMMLVLRAFLTRAKWDLPACEEKNITFCDPDGKLSVAAVAASANGKELGEVMVEGIQAEVLSWRMDVEEPDAASIISQALNQPQQMAMRTTELTAVAVLKGEIIVQLGKDLSQRVAFQTVRDRVRAQLHTAADDPDLPEVFDFLISSGVGTNAYVDHLLEWTACFVDSKKRQLRFAAFAVVNKMCEQGVWSRMAVVKRAYRKQPSNGFCPSPEAAWGTFSWAHLQKLEDLLRFFHGSCKDLVDKMKPQSRILFLGNIDVAAAESFWAAKDPKLKYGEQKIQEILLAGTKKYLAQLGLEEDEEKVNSLYGRAHWICFKKDAEPGQAIPTAVETSSAPSVIKFDEITGTQLNTQVDFGVPSEEKKQAHKLPWREWRSGIGSSLGQTEADKSAAVAILHGLHGCFAVDLEPIEVWQQEGNTFVTATRKAKAYDIMLPPCVPKQSKVLERSEHPHAVGINLRVIRPTGQCAEGQEGQILRTATYFVNPEFKTPKRKEAKAAPAVAEARASQLKGDESDDEWVWGPLGEQTMNPFWAVRRMTQKQLATQAALTAPGKVRPRFNCMIDVQTMTCVTVGVVRSQPLNTSRMCDVPFLINSLEVAEGEELILEVGEKKAKIDVKRTWKHAFQDEERVNKAKKAQPAPGPLK